MQIARIQFSVWRLMTVIAAVACFAASLVEFTTLPSSAAPVNTAWATLYGTPLILIFARGVRMGRLAKLVATTFVCGLPIVGFVALVHLPSAPLVALLVGWAALMAVALFPGTLGKLVDAMFAPAPVTVSDPELPPLRYDPNWARTLERSR
jgi:hypothetical protein